MFYARTKRIGGKRMRGKRTAIQLALCCPGRYDWSSVNLLLGGFKKPGIDSEGES